MYNNDNRVSNNSNLKQRNSYEKDLALASFIVTAYYCLCMDKKRQYAPKLDY